MCAVAGARHGERKYDIIYGEMKLWVAIFSAMPILAQCAAHFEPPALPASQYPDTEAATNLVFDAGAVRDNRWTLSFELDATAANNAQVEFGVDADDDGVLGANEREFIVGWDCGAWFVRDKRGGTERRMTGSPGRNKLEWTLHSTSEKAGRALEGNVFSGGDVATWFNPAWDMARVVARGEDAALALVKSEISIAPLAIRIR